MKKTRLDELLVKRGLCRDVAQAMRMVLAREVKVGDAYATSAAIMVACDAEVSVKEKPAYVSRGGIKLRGALDAFQIDVCGMHCIDVGCSTGGFTDCLLQAGASSVAAVDVGYGNLAWKLQCDSRVHVFERTNIRLADPIALGAPFDCIVADLSFIGLASLAPVFAALAREGSIFVGLVKPQFESKHNETDSRGLVKDQAVRARTVSEVQDALRDAGFQTSQFVESSIRGAKSKNIEYLVMATYNPGHLTC